MPSRQEALERFVYEVSHDFQGSGCDAPTWAEGYPKQWGDEAERIELELQAIDGKAVSQAFRRNSSAISADEKVLAATDDKGILIYDIETKELRQRIRDGEYPIKSLWFAQSPKIPNYMLVCSRENARGSEGTVEIVQLDRFGRLILEDPALDVEGLASKALTAIQQDLVDEYQWSGDTNEFASIASGFEEVLATAEKRHATKSKTVIQGSIAGFGSTPFDSTGRFMLYRQHNTTTQHGMRPPEQLPHIIVYDLIENKDSLSLSGHTDTITWAGYSPDNSLIASVSWDGSMRVYAATDGALVWKTDTGGGQAWCASFSWDSRYIVASTERGRIVTIHNSNDGYIIAQLDAIEVNDWVRNLAWRPTNDYCIALTHRKSVYIWRPFEEKSNQLQQSLSISDGTDGGYRGFMSLHVAWLDDGQKIIVTCADGTIEIWDLKTNMKWRMLKPQGKLVETVLGRRYLIKVRSGEKQLVSLDGDRVVRFWSL